MSAREELAQSIATNLDKVFGKREFGPATQDYVLADALLAEGWGKVADAWDEGHRTPMQREMDDCRCGAYYEGECGCGKYGTGKIITPNPYRPQQ